MDTCRVVRRCRCVEDVGYIDFLPGAGYMYVPVYDPYVVFARPRPGFFVGEAIRFGGGFRWNDGYNRFDWRRHEVFLNRRVWPPPVRTSEPRRTGLEQRRFEENRQNFTGARGGISTTWTQGARGRQTG